MIQNKAYLYSNAEPDENQKKKLVAFLSKKHGINDFEFVKDDSIKGGFKLLAGDKEYDWTNEGRLKQLNNALGSLTDDTNIIPLIKKTVDGFEAKPVYEEVGTVLTVGDGIATISGLDSAEYGEILLFDSGVKGLVQDLSEDTLGCILFDSGENVSQGSSVRRTGKVADMPVSDEYIGRVIDSLGNPIDGLGEITPVGYRPIEKHAPEITDRQPVNTPLETGILSIDTMFPIGRGQRELIIGDRQTGKTAIAIDTIINQKGKDVICIYVAIGQKASSVATLVNTLKKYGAMDYSIVVNSPASDPAPLQYIAPYAGCALGEYFMEKGKDVLIIYDDLSKHAVAYRTISLLLGRTPGREAYPGDIFYLHSRLLERSTHLCDELGGGSLTALPIVETQAGDISAYIPTNVISITDGQLFLETDLFFSGQRPAVNIGISVSRVGRDAQAPVVKKACGTLKIDLAQYQEKLVFTQFSSDLDQETKDSLEFGKGLMHMLRQKQYNPISRHRLVIMLTAALNKCLMGLDENEIDEYIKNLCESFEAANPMICEKIDKTGSLTDEETQSIKDFAVNMEK